MTRPTETSPTQLVGAVAQPKGGSTNHTPPKFPPGEGRQQDAARPGQLAGRTPLGTTREKGFHPTSDQAKQLSQEHVNRLIRRAEGRRSAAKVRKYHKQFHGGTGWAQCGTIRRSSKVAVRRGNGRVTVSGVKSCGSQAACISCGTKIRAKRCAEIQLGLRNLLKDGGSAIFATFTIPHYLNDRLEDLWPTLSACWKSVISGRTWQDFKQIHDVIGYISATEATNGANAGWHPHKHQLFCFDRDIEPYSDEFITIAQTLHSRWKKAVRKHLGREISDAVGVDIRAARDAAGMGEYLSKIGAELALTSHKQGRNGNRTPWQIIADGLATGNKEDLDLFAEWCRVSKGKKLIQWSAGLRKRLLPDLEEMTDEELANEEELDAETEAYLSGDLWDVLNRRYDGAAGELLNVWEQATPTTAINKGRHFLASIGIQTTITKTTDGDPLISRTRHRANRAQRNSLRSQSLA